MKLPASPAVIIFEAFDFEYSLDGAEWVVASRGVGEAPRSGCCVFHEITFPTRTARFWRLSMAQTLGGNLRGVQYLELLVAQHLGPGGVASRTLVNLPPVVHGAVFFAVGGASRAGASSLRPATPPLAAGGFFTVTVQVPCTVFLVAVDGRKGEWGVYRSGFRELGWEEVPSLGFSLAPWGVDMACWRRQLGAGQYLEVPHTDGLYGSVAVKAV